MSIYTSDVEKCGVVVMPDNSVVVTFKKNVGLESFEGIKITTPRQAHDIRSAVNEAVDILLKNNLKTGL